jgi:hypothetical protein
LKKGALSFLDQREWRLDLKVLAAVQPAKLKADREVRSEKA